jgi:ankyrin repeat protein
MTLGRRLFIVQLKKNELQSIQLLIDKKSNLEEKDEKGRTAVHFAAENGHTECLKYLIELGADLHVADKKGRTPIQKAGSDGPSPCWQLLSENTE